MKKIPLIILLFNYLTVAAQLTSEGNSIITDRPDQTESPYAVPKGVIQIESGLLFERYELNSSVVVHRNVYPTNLFRIGLFDRLELRIQNEVVSYRSINSQTQQEIAKLNGTENMQIGFKYQFSQDNSKIVAGLMAHSVLPTGSRGIGNERYGIIGRFNLSYDVSEKRNISTNIGYDNRDLIFNERGLVRKANGNFFYTLTYVAGIGEKIGLYVEAFGSYDEFENWRNNMDAGMTYLLSPTVQLDYSYGWGVDRVMNYHSVGISMRLPN